MKVLGWYIDPDDIKNRNTLKYLYPNGIKKRLSVHYRYLDDFHKKVIPGWSNTGICWDIVSWCLSVDDLHTGNSYF